MVYVDTGPAVGALDPDFAVRRSHSLHRTSCGRREPRRLSEAQLETFRRRAVPEPGAALRDAAELRNEARLDVPSTVVCTGYTSEEYKDAVKEGYPFVAGLAELRKVTYIDLPTSHWPMWSRPEDLARIIGDVARNASRA